MIEAVFRIESARIIAGITRIVRDLGQAEELAQDALVAALERWPKGGIPENPGAWLMAVAKHRAIDSLRRTKLLERKHEQIGRTLEAERSTDASAIEASLDDEVGDDLLRLIFTACHPVLSDGSARGAHSPFARGFDHRGDRAGLSRSRGDGRPADRARQADDREGGRFPTKCPAARSSPPASNRCSR